MARKRPINAEVPPAEESVEETPAKPAGEPKAPKPAEKQPAAELTGPPRSAEEGQPTKEQQAAKPAKERTRAAAIRLPRPRGVPLPSRRRKRGPVPLALKLIAAAVAIAVVFVLIAILGGTGGEEQSAPGPAPGGTEGKAKPSTAAAAAEDLGFPAFATKNTTRVGGSDPASNAAAVALAVFPSTNDEQRPGAVTLVNEDDWRSAIAAAVLMAAPVRAPILISGPDGVPDPTAQALDALERQEGEVETRAFLVGNAEAPDGLRVSRLHGSNPAATAAAIAKQRNRLFSGAPEHIVIAAADQPAFAMPAAAWAARSGDPVLFANRNRLPSPTAAALKRTPKVPIYVLGPGSAISAAVVKEIAAISKHVTRVAGNDPPANSVAFARYSSDGFGWHIVDPGHGFVVARDDSPLDAAAAAPLSASGTWGPLLVSDDADTLPPVLRDYLLDVKPGYTDNPTRAFYNHVWVIGDQEAISVNEQSEIDALAELAKIGGP
jgi:Cell wall binding domain 2 (CWB2)